MIKYTVPIFPTSSANVILCPLTICCAVPTAIFNLISADVIFLLMSLGGTWVEPEKKRFFVAL